VPGALPRALISEAEKPYNLSLVNEARKYFSKFRMILGAVMPLITANDESARLQVAHLS
jgi:hypothetical protein